MLIEKIRQDIKQAMKDKDAQKSGLLRILAADAVALGRQKENRDPTDDEVIRTVRKFISNANQTLELKKASSLDHADTAQEIATLSGYLPTELTEAEIKAAVDQILADAGAEPTKAAIGVIMKGLKDRFKGRFDGKKVNAVLSTYLS